MTLVTGFIDLNRDLANTSGRERRDLGIETGLTPNTIVSLLFRYCFAIVSLSFRYCFAIVSLLFRFCFPIVSLLFRYCMAIVWLLFGYCLGGLVSRWVPSLPRRRQYNISWHHFQNLRKMPRSPPRVTLLYRSQRRYSSMSFNYK